MLGREVARLNCMIFTSLMVAVWCIVYMNFDHDKRAYNTN
jgi:hypothetical protein